MDIEFFREYCLSKKGTSESFPFDDKILVFKVIDKMFAAVDVDIFESANLKCDPEKAIELRESNEGILPGYHMNKKHWNSVMMDGSVHDRLIQELIDHSYNLVVQKLPKKVKEELNYLE